MTPTGAKPEPTGLADYALWSPTAAAWLEQIADRLRGRPAARDALPVLDALVADLVAAMVALAVARHAADLVGADSRRISVSALGEIAGRARLGRDLERMAAPLRALPSLVPEATGYPGKALLVSTREQRKRGDRIWGAGAPRISRQEHAQRLLRKRRRDNPSTGKRIVTQWSFMELLETDGPHTFAVGERLDFQGYGSEPHEVDEISRLAPSVLSRLPVGHIGGETRDDYVLSLLNDYVAMRGRAPTITHVDDPGAARALARMRPLLRHRRWPHLIEAPGPWEHLELVAGQASARAVDVFTALTASKRVELPGLMSSSNGPETQHVIPCKLRARNEADGRPEHLVVTTSGSSWRAWFSHGLSPPQISELRRVQESALRPGGSVEHLRRRQELLGGTLGVDSLRQLEGVRALAGIADGLLVEILGGAAIHLFRPPPLGRYARSTPIASSPPSMVTVSPASTPSR